MIDSRTLEECKKDKEILQLKISYLEHAIRQLEGMVSEAKVDIDSLAFLRRKIADSLQDLETLYLLKHLNDKGKSEEI